VRALPSRTPSLTLPRFAGEGIFAVIVALTACACGSGGGGGNGAPPTQTAAAASSTPTTTATRTPEPSPSPSPTATAQSDDARIARAYPDLAAIYGAAHGIYRSCGPNFGVCHNSRQYPNLRSLEAVAGAVGEPCNQLRDDPLQVHDWCEGGGDFLRIGDRRIEIGSFVRLDEEGLRWRIRLREDPPGLEAQVVDVVRVLGGEPRLLVAGLEAASLAALGAGEGGPAIDVGLAGVASAAAIAGAFSTAGVPGNPAVIRLGDPNRNGIFGAGLGNALILPAHPERSYLMMRLVNPDFGTLMPLANCCFWTKDALRALWCWIAGLEEDGGNVLGPIDYAECPAGPQDEALYPEPGEGCEAQGLCPVQPIRTPVAGDGFAPVFAILRANCGGAACHVGGNAGGFSIAENEDLAYDAVLTRVVFGSAAESPLYIRIDRSLCDLPACIPMPFGAAPLAPQDVDTIGRWIESGARR
jgi:hypothetical protein